MRIAWLGQGGYLLQSSSFRLVFDLYLSDLIADQGYPRLVCPPLDLQQLRPDVLVASHDHLDHLDPQAAPQIAKLYPRCRFIGPRSVAEHLSALGVAAGRIVTVAPGDSCQAGPFLLRATPALHTDPHAVGLIIQAEDRTLYFSGDSEYAASLAPSVKELAGGPIDLAVVCINGRLGNMDDAHAVMLVKELDPVAAVPTHYGMFAANTADPQPFVQACRAAGIAAHALNLGEAVELQDLLKV